MGLKSEFMAVGTPGSAASRLGFEPVANFTAAGTTQGTATVLTANNANVTTSSIGAGVIMLSGEQKYMVFNAGPNVLTVYPPVGHAFCGLGTNVGITIAVNSSVKVDPAAPLGHTWVTGQ